MDNGPAGHSGCVVDAEPAPRGRLSPVRLRLRDREHAGAARLQAPRRYRRRARSWCTSRARSRGSTSTQVAPVVPARPLAPRGSGCGRRARGAGAQAHGRAARRTGGAGGDGVGDAGRSRTGRDAPRARRGAVGAGTTVMTPLQFRADLPGRLGGARSARSIACSAARPARSAPRSSVSGARVAALYRRACENLALARARSYPAYMVDRLERLTADAHQVIYQRREFGLARVRDDRRRRLSVAPSGRSAAYLARCGGGVPAAERSSSACWSCRRPELILSVVSSETAASFEEMYSPSAELDRPDAHGDDRLDDVRLLHPQQHRRGVSMLRRRTVRGPGHACSSSPTTARSRGALAGYLTARGLSATFYPFIATHSAFELTAIVLSGAAGLRIGHALSAPGPPDAAAVARRWRRGIPRSCCTA